jgi:hypothetical protein
MIKPLKRPLFFLGFYVQTEKDTKHRNLIALHNSDNHGSIRFIKRAKTQMIKTMIIIKNQKKDLILRTKIKQTDKTKETQLKRFNNNVEEKQGYKSDNRDITYQ